MIRQGPSRQDAGAGQHPLAVERVRVRVVRSESGVRVVQREQRVGRLRRRDARRRSDRRRGAGRQRRRRRRLAVRVVARHGERAQRRSGVGAVHRGGRGQQVTVRERRVHERRVAGRGERLDAGRHGARRREREARVGAQVLQELLGRREALAAVLVRRDPVAHVRPTRRQARAHARRRRGGGRRRRGRRRDHTGRRGRRLVVALIASGRARRAGSARRRGRSGRRGGRRQAARASGAVRIAAHAVVALAHCGRVSEAAVRAQRLLVGEREAERGGRIGGQVARVSGRVAEGAQCGRCGRVEAGESRVIGRVDAGHGLQRREHGPVGAERGAQRILSELLLGGEGVERGPLRLVHLGVGGRGERARSGTGRSGRRRRGGRLRAGAFEAGLVVLERRGRRFAVRRFLAVRLFRGARLVRRLVRGRHARRHGRREHRRRAGARRWRGIGADLAASLGE